MLYQIRHGQSVALDPVTQVQPDRQPVGAAWEGAAQRQAPSAPFGYYFPDAPTSDATAAALDRLAAAMATATERAEASSRIPVVFTYLGQFLDHDLVALAERDGGLWSIDGPGLAPLHRRVATAGLANLRSGRLSLESLYGGATEGSVFSRRLTQALRDPEDPAKMRLGSLVPSELGRVPLPADGGGDLLRLGCLLQDPGRQFDTEDLLALPRALRQVFVSDRGRVRVQRAVLGEPRNDQNLALAQLHLALLRFHNALAAAPGAAPGAALGAPAEDPQAAYGRAQQQLRWTLQWLVLNVYLPTVCDPAIVRETLEREAPLYAAFLSAHRPSEADSLPIPLEFAAAAFRFGHAMVRSSYDWNRYHGRAAAGARPLQPRADLRQLFAYTGAASKPMPRDSRSSYPRLPGHWAVEWERLVGGMERYPDRAARLIDTNLSPRLFDLPNEPPETEGLFGNLARRTLRRGLRLNLPSAQDCIAGIYCATGAAVESLGASDLVSGHTGEAVRAGGFIGKTPLWFYLLKEAEIQAEGQRLGQLGSRLVAETLAGLVIEDPTSYWHRSGADGGRWRPADGVRPAGEAVESIPALLRAARLL